MTDNTAMIATTNPDSDDVVNAHVYYAYTTDAHGERWSYAMGCTVAEALASLASAGLVVESWHLDGEELHFTAHVGD